MSAMFDRDQLEWLRAMGHEVVALAPAAPAQPGVREPAASAATGAAALEDSPLMRALMRACAGDADCLRRLGVVAAALREDAAAKRALWPALRAARRARRA